MTKKEISIGGGLVQRKPLTWDRWSELHEVTGKVYHAINNIMLKVQLIHAFVEYESDKQVGEEIQIHAIATILEDIKSLIEVETEKIWQLYMDLMPFTHSGSDNAAIADD